MAATLSIAVDRVRFHEHVDTLHVHIGRRNFREIDAAFSQRVELPGEGLAADVELHDVALADIDGAGLFIDGDTAGGGGSRNRMAQRILDVFAVMVSHRGNWAQRGSSQQDRDSFFEGVHCKVLSVTVFSSNETILEAVHARQHDPNITFK